MKESSLFLSEQLVNFLDNDLVITTHSDIVTDLSPEVPEKTTCLNLLANVQIDRNSHISDNQSSSRIKGPRKFSDKFQLRLQKKLFSSQKDLETKCKLLAIDPEDIISRKGVFPWPEPKNVRYIEKYRKVKTLKNGSILAVSITEETSKDLERVRPLHEPHPKKKVKVKPQNKPQSVESKIKNNSNDNTARKQKRKRGLKKKNKLVESV